MSERLKELDAFIASAHEMAKLSGGPGTKQFADAMEEASIYKNERYEITHGLSKGDLKTFGRKRS